MALITSPDPRTVVRALLEKSSEPLSLRELAESARRKYASTPWRDVRRAVWAMMEDGTVRFTPDWTIALQGKKWTSGGRHGRTRPRRQALRRTA